ncbi:MAG: GTPase ObgE [Alphaproteobacteria bacterium]|nr:GTPase ObgE [Alphaproteobacteria bacterium]
MQFLDQAKIFIQSGKGGDGITSFRREKFVPQGGPDGGDGGRGGSVIITANPHLNTLMHFRFKQHFKAESGHNGMGQNKAGKAGKDLVIEVPLGTQIFDATGQMLVYDFKHKYDEYKILSGGRGGIGNVHFKSSVNQAPTRSIKGHLGEEMNIWLKLKLLSDAGLVGLPNAGKSTFLSVVTSAKPKIADYPFTTISPGLGVVKIYDEEFVLADIPGLIEGAHTGSGLGDRFLQHIERCGVIAHIIDVNSDNVIDSYNIIRNELESYSSDLAKKQEIICLNKVDTKKEDEVKLAQEELESYTGKKIYLISAAGNMGMKEVIKEMWAQIQAQRLDSTSIAHF